MPKAIFLLVLGLLLVILFSLSALLLKIIWMAFYG
jgi:hypothetical protein